MNDIQLTQDTRLVSTLENIKKSIVELQDIHELTSIENMASGFEEAWRKYYRSSGFGFEQMFLGWETKVRSERRMGELLKDTVKAGNPQLSHDETIGLEELGISRTQSSRYQQLAKTPEEKFNKKIEELRCSFIEPTTKVLMMNITGAHVGHNSGENEWYTPSKYIEAARKTMGSIDLDPASSDIANKIVKATTYYTIDKNGLEQIWEGNVWMNPPYSQPDIEYFIEKLTTDIQNKRINQACVLVNNATETHWFQILLGCSTSVCFHKGRIKFIDKEGNLGEAPLQGQAILYFGNNKKEFYNNFSEFGTILWNKEE